MWSILAQKTSTVSEDPVTKANELWHTVKTFLATQGLQFAINVVVALAIFVVGKWIANILSRFCNRLMKQAKVDETLARFLSNIVYSILLVIVVLAALSELLEEEGSSLLFKCERRAPRLLGSIARKLSSKSRMQD